VRLVTPRFVHDRRAAATGALIAGPLPLIVRS